MKRVVFIRSDGIYMDSRAIKEVTALLEAGYHVNILGWDRDGAALEQCSKIFTGNNRPEYYFFDSRVIGIIGGIRNIGVVLNWLRWIYKQLKAIGQIDIIHACDFDTGAAAYRYCKHHKVKFVYDIYDYYVDTHMMPSLLSGIVERMEINTINLADLTIICTEERKEQINKSAPKNLIIIHNSPDVPEVPEINEEYDYAYVGDLNDVRLIDGIFSHYHENSDLRCYFVGNGDLVNVAEQLDSQYEMFTFGGRALPYSEVILLESKAMCLAAIYDPSYRNHRLCAPNKFYEALALAKPVIVCKGTGIDKIVKNCNIGIVIDYNAPEFYNAIRELKDHKTLRESMGRNARALYEEKYRWSIMKERLTEAYANL